MVKYIAYLCWNLAFILVVGSDKKRIYFFVPWVSKVHEICDFFSAKFLNLQESPSEDYVVMWIFYANLTSTCLSSMRKIFHHKFWWFNTWTLCLTNVAKVQILFVLNLVGKFCCSEHIHNDLATFSFSELLDLICKFIWYVLQNE